MRIFDTFQFDAPMLHRNAYPTGAEDVGPSTTTTVVSPRVPASGSAPSLEVAALTGSGSQRFKSRHCQIGVNSSEPELSSLYHSSSTHLNSDFWFGELKTSAKAMNSCKNEPLLETRSEKSSDEVLALKIPKCGI